MLIMEVVTRTLLAHTIRIHSLLFAHVRLDTRTLEQEALSNVKVSIIYRRFGSAAQALFSYTIDSCNVNNGGCDKNAVCSHDKATFAVVCTCKTGYTNVGSDNTVKCDGPYHSQT